MAQEVPQWISSVWVVMEDEIVAVMVVARWRKMEEDHSLMKQY